jgi:predicted Rossmann fold nucleotide-binding protein DprA/Smf involved in DNA uptake
MKARLIAARLPWSRGGIDVVYPEENLKLYQAIAERGLVVAESPLGQKPFAQSFPKRNRIVSGLSKACIVVEATMRSGSLITARLAGEQGRDVMAVPGSPMDPRAEGPNHLIREGATLISSAEDILEIIMNFFRQCPARALIYVATVHHGGGERGGCHPKCAGNGAFQFVIHTHQY